MFRILFECDTDTEVAVGAKPEQPFYFTSHIGDMGFEFMVPEGRWMHVVSGVALEVCIKESRAWHRAVYASRRVSDETFPVIRFANMYIEFSKFHTADQARLVITDSKSIGTIYSVARVARNIAEAEQALVNFQRSMDVDLPARIVKLRDELAAAEKKYTEGMAHREELIAEYASVIKAQTIELDAIRVAK